MRNTVITLMLAILAGATWLATWQRQDTSPPADRVETAGPLGYYLRGARLSGTDEQGRVIYRIRAERLDELPDEDGLRMTAVNIEYQPPDETAWSISAASASSPKDGSQLDLAGHVEVRTAPTDGSKPWTIATEKLRFSPDTSSAESDEPVRVRVGNWEWSAVGLRTHLKGDTLELESEVHGTLSR